MTTTCRRETATIDGEWWLISVLFALSKLDGGDLIFLFNIFTTRVLHNKRQGVTSRIRRNGSRFEHHLHSASAFAVPQLWMWVIIPAKTLQQGIQNDDDDDDNPYNNHKVPNAMSLGLVSQSAKRLSHWAADDNFLNWERWHWARVGRTRPSFEC